MASSAGNDGQSKGRSRFTLAHGFAVSVALHAVVGAPFILQRLAPAPEEPPVLVIEFQGVVAQSQAEQKVLQETKGEAKQDEVKEEAPPTTAASASAAGATEMSDDRPKEITEDKDAFETAALEEQQPAQTPAEASPAPVVATSGASGINTTIGVEDYQVAQTIKAEPDESDLIRAYVKLLTKKVQANLVYPAEGRRAGLRGTATVSFTIMGNGRIRQAALKIIVTSGQPRLDESALQTIRASAPFGPPPREMTVMIAVSYGRKP
jgi:protein TonB